MLAPRALLAAGLIGALVLPTFVNAAPSVVVDVRVGTIQRLVDSLMSVGEVRAAFKDGETLAVDLTDSGLGDYYRGTIGPSGTPMTARGLADDRATHTLSLNGASAVTLANAYDTANTAKLLIKGGYVGLHSKSTAVQLAFNALVKTPADARLASYDPKIGDAITYAGCSGTLSTSKTEGYFQARLCDADYVVNRLGGVNGKIPNVKLADVCRDQTIGGRSLGLMCGPGLSEPYLSGGDQYSIRQTCAAGLGARPTTFPDSRVWDHAHSKCIRDNLRGST